MHVGENAGLLTIGRISGGNGEFLAVAGADYLISDLTQVRGILDLPSDSPSTERT
jgi:hypothetical protein